MMKCDTCLLRYHCDHISAHECQTNEFNRYEKDERIQTHGDWVRSMNDDELAQFLSDLRCGNCMRRGNNCFPGSMDVWVKEQMKG